jgi:hypothetical protein
VTIQGEAQSKHFSRGTAIKRIKLDNIADVLDSEHKLTGNYVVRLTFSKLMLSLSNSI